MKGTKEDARSLPQGSTLGQRIQFQRLQAGLTKTGLAQSIGVSDVTVSYWERGIIKQIGHQHVMGLSRAFGITASELLADPQLPHYHHRIRRDVLNEVIEKAKQEGRKTPWLIKLLGDDVTANQADDSSECSRQITDDEREAKDW